MGTTSLSLAIGAECVAGLMRTNVGLRVILMPTRSALLIQCILGLCLMIQSARVDMCKALTTLLNKELPQVWMRLLRKLRLNLLCLLVTTFIQVASQNIAMELVPRMTSQRFPSSSIP